jgi:hypothetical protein
MLLAPTPRRPSNGRRRDIPGPLLRHTTTTTTYEHCHCASHSRLPPRLSNPDQPDEPPSSVGGPRRPRPIPSPLSQDPVTHALHALLLLLYPCIWHSCHPRYYIVSSASGIHTYVIYMVFLFFIFKNKTKNIHTYIIII